MPDTPLVEAETPPRQGFLQAAAGYFAGLWRGEMPLARVFWTDMIAVGTVVNLLASAAAMLLFVAGAPVAFGVAAHFAPVPYNILLFFAVWQSAARESSMWSFPAQAAALVWVILSIAV